MNKKRIAYIIRKVLLNSSTPEEEDELDQHFQQAFHSKEWDEKYLGNKQNVEKRIKSNVYKAISKNDKWSTRAKMLVRYAAVAALFSLIGFVTYRISLKDTVDNNIVETQKYLQPGSDVASLVMADGNAMDLSDLTYGETIQKSGLALTKSKEGYLEYTQNTNNSSSTKVSWITLKTPLGGNYQIVLEDGTKVWLNAGSSLRFPSQFTADKRKVEASGEVYFEVARNELKPFVVEANGLEVEVLGTSFNLSSFDGVDAGSPTIALLEGKVNVKNKRGGSVNLNPGEKAFVRDSEIGVNHFDLDTEMAWKNNYFVFKKQNIKEIMSALARWYDAEVVYSGEGWQDKNYTIRMSRRESIKEVLSIIELTKTIRFKIEERRITVFNN